MNRIDLMGTYGGDLTHVQSAWTSTYRELTPDKLERMPAMLSGLAKEGHHTPFEKSTLHFLVTCDTASHIHLLKHRIGVSINAESARYKELQDDKFHVPEDWPNTEQIMFKNEMKKTYRKYHELLARLEVSGISRKRAKESARFLLPYANQITMDVSFNFRSFMHFQGLRNNEHAQMEIHDIAEYMLSLVQETGDFKYSLKAFGYE